MNKKGGFTDLFLLMIVSFVILIISGIFIYITNVTNDQLHETLDGSDMFGTANATQVIDDTMGKYEASLGNLQWITAMIILGMVIAIFMGSYMVTTHPITFVPYIIVTMIAVVVSVGISNAYESMISEPLLASTYSTFTASNYFMLYLPAFVSIIGIFGGVIMFISWSRRENVTLGY